MTHEPPIEPDIPILIGEHDEHDPNQHEIPSHPDSVHDLSLEMPSTEATIDPSPFEHSRPKRTTRPPKYLEDYIRY